MIEMLRQAWREYLHPMMQRPKRLQVAALCYKTDTTGKKVLLITSRGTQRWILPKGWPMRGKNAPEAALQEAWEEAGVRGRTPETQAIGTYTYDKTQSTGWAIPVQTLVYPVAVRELCDEFPEAHERQRRWVNVEDAANMVQEPELKSILRAFN